MVFKLLNLFNFILFFVRYVSLFILKEILLLEATIKKVVTKIGVIRIVVIRFVVTRIEVIVMIFGVVTSNKFIKEEEFMQEDQPLLVFMFKILFEVVVMG